MKLFLLVLGLAALAEGAAAEVAPELTAEVAPEVAAEVAAEVAPEVAAEVAPGETPYMRFYHESAGFAEAARLRQYEHGRDFDGSRISGGQSVGAGTQPHLGGLVIAMNHGGTSVCGCSMLTNTRAVTAAHCWWDGRNQARQFTVVYGSNRLFSGGVRVNTNQVTLHGSWNPWNLANDVAIIQHNHVNYNNVIQRINLPAGTQLTNNFAGTWAMAAGFGRTGDNVAITNNQDKRQVSLQVITNEACRRTFDIVVPTTLCTSGAGGRSICPGDSGGPLAIGSGNNRVLIGVTSFLAVAGCQRGFPSGFARATSFAAWIRARI